MAPSEYERLAKECARLIDRLHDGMHVHADMQAEDPEHAGWVADLRNFRRAILTLSFDTFGDPEAEETLAREGDEG